MKKTVFRKTLATLALAVLLTSTVTVTAYAKTIPNEYKEFTRESSEYYHALTITTNREIKPGEIVMRTRTPVGGEAFEAWYVSIGGNKLKLSTPEGEILTAQELDEYFSQNPAPQTESNQLAWEMELLLLVNTERERLGIAPVALDSGLTTIAALKAGEMAELNYFSHTSPNYGKPTQFAKHYGYTKRVSENLHRGTSSTARQVFDIWMNSTSGHRENMLNPKWQSIGIGTAERHAFCGDGTIKSIEYYNVQLFSQ